MFADDKTTQRSDGVRQDSGSFISGSNTFLNESRFGAASSDNKKPNLWQSLLKDVGQRQDNGDSHILLLGDRSAGKRSLIKAMNKPFLKQLGLPATAFDDIGSGYSLFETSFLYVKELGDLVTESGNLQSINIEENLARINVWIISEEDMGKMIPRVLTPDDLENTVAIIVPDLEQPWDIMNQCEKWIKVLKDAIFSMSPKLPLKTLESLKDRTVDLYKTYEEPELDKEGKLLNKKMKKKLNRAQLNMSQQNNSMDDSMSRDAKLDDIDVSLMEDQEMMDDLRKEMELPEGILVTNMFVPLIVTCSKTDLIEHGDRDLKNLLEQNLDFMQYKLRKFALSYGASLIFTSTNSGSNVQLMYEYIVHRLHDTDFLHTSNINDKEALFVPTGFDSPDLIEQTDIKKILAQQKHEVDAETVGYNEIIQKPAIRNALRGEEEEKKEIECPDWKRQLEHAFAEKESRPTSSRPRLAGAGHATMAANKMRATMDPSSAPLEKKSDAPSGDANSSAGRASITGTSDASQSQKELNNRKLIQAKIESLARKGKKPKPAAAAGAPATATAAPAEEKPSQPAAPTVPPE